jgi:D-amino-acid dehydrogenase
MQQVLVIGGGVVGLTSAWWLLEAGYQVTLLEREPDIGRAASFRNGGQLSYRYVAPLADAGIPLKALQWMFEKDSPLKFRPEADARQWRWLGQFLANCNAADNRRTTAKLLELGELSRQSMGQLEMTIPLEEFSWRDAGKLVVYRSQAIYNAAVARPESEDTREVLSADECAVMEPALQEARQSLAGGIFTRGEAVADCHGFCEALGRRLRAHPRFGGIVHAEALRFAVHNGRVSGLETSIGPLSADKYVLAAGIQSRTLGATAGLYLPIYPLKGYSLTAPIGLEHRPPEISVTDFERKTLYARIGSNLRVAAMVDMVGEDTRLDPQRIGSLLKLARQTMPQAADYEQVTKWAGLRPATPNSAPILGATPLDNLWLNVGHGPLGFTFACGTAAILAKLIAGQPAPFDLGLLAYR